MKVENAETLFITEVSGDSVLELKDGKYYFIILGAILLLLYIMGKPFKYYIIYF